MKPIQYLLLLSIVWPFFCQVLSVSATRNISPRLTRQNPQGANNTIAVYYQGYDSDDTSNRLQIDLPGDNNSTFKLENRFDCLSPYFDRACWEVLGMNDWLTQWREKIPTCTSNDTAVIDSCMMPNEAWTQTFLRMYYRGDTGKDCYNIKQNDCDNDPNKVIIPTDSPLLTARYEYGRHAIILIGRFFDSWFEAISNTMGKATDLIKPIVDKVDPPKTTHLWLAIITQLITFGLMFVPGGAAISAAANALTGPLFDNIKHGVEITNSLAQAIFPKSTQDTSSAQIDDIINNWSKPGGTMQMVEARLGDTLQIVQGRNASDGIAPFLAFTSKGDFAVASEAQPVPHIAELGTNMLMLQAFLTYLTSVALWKNNWKTLAIPGLDMRGVQNGTSPCPSWAPNCKHDSPIDFCGSYDNNTFCKGKYWWRSEEHDTMYTIVKDEKLYRPEGQAVNIIQSILGNNWTTGALLFENAAVCEYLTLFPNTSHATYVPRSGSSAAGFAYLPPFADMDKYAKDFNSTHKFVAINGDAFVQLAKRDDYDKKFDRPDRGNTPFGIVPDGQEDVAQGLDLSCISQMRTIVATAWRDVNWRKGSGKA